MALTKLQDRIYEASNPIEVDLAVEQLRQMLIPLEWISHPYHIAQRFYEKANERAFYYPETYIPNANDTNYTYHKLTPDNDYTGMFFFMVGPEKNNYSPNQFNYLTYPVSIIFSANLKLIDNTKLKSGLFTQELISSARRVLTNGGLGLNFQYKIKTVTRDLRECYREFVLDDLKQYNRAPMQCFRFELELTVREMCGA